MGDGSSIATGWLAGAGLGLGMVLRHGLLKWRCTCTSAATNTAQQKHCAASMSLLGRLLHACVLHLVATAAAAAAAASSTVPSPTEAPAMHSSCRSHLHAAAVCSTCMQPPGPQNKLYRCCIPDSYCGAAGVTMRCKATRRCREMRTARKV